MNLLGVGTVLVLVPVPQGSGNGFKSMVGSSPSRDHHHFPHRRFNSSFQGIFDKRGRHLKQCHFIPWSTDTISATRTSCLCFFGGNPTRKETSNDGWLSRKISIKSSFQGRWTNVLLGTNVMLHIAQIATEGNLIFWGAKINSLIDEGQLWRLVTSSFLHADIGHLMVNSFSLYSVGPTVERLYGPQRFFTIYFASAVSSSVMSYWLCEAPAVGASGAIFGLVGSVAVFSMRHKGPHSSGSQDLRHMVEVIALNMIIGLLSRGIDNWGHLGGLLGGAAISWFIDPTLTH